MNPNLTSGITGAAPIWHEIMENITAGRPDKVYTIPSDVTTLPCYGRIEYFIRGTEPKGGCVLPPTNTPEPTKQP
jgi:membrane carboxypeptidase/penicillin-binding protein